MTYKQNMKAQRRQFPSRRWCFVVAELTAAAICFFASQAPTSAATLSDKNSLINLNLNSSAGMTGWSVDGANQVDQQWFWFRIGTGPQFDVSTIGAPTITTLGTKQLTALYSNSLYGVSISYTLTGGSAGTGHSALTEAVNFYNYQGGASLDLHLFMYSQFALGGAAHANAQNVLLSSSTSVQTVSGLGASNTVAFPFSPANRVEAAPYAQTYIELTTTSNLLLNNNLSAGPGNVTWAFEWDKSLAPNTSLGTITLTDTLQVPEPSAMSLALLGLGLGLIRSV